MLKKHKLRNVLFISFLLIGLTFAVYLSLRPQGAFETRRKAAEIELKGGSTLSFSGPKQVKVGEKFSVDLILDTTNDPDYTVSGVDAVVYVGPEGDVKGIETEFEFGWETEGRFCPPMSISCIQGYHSCEAPPAPNGCPRLKCCPDKTPTPIPPTLAPITKPPYNTPTPVPVTKPPDNYCRDNTQCKDDKECRGERCQTPICLTVMPPVCQEYYFANHKCLLRNLPDGKICNEWGDEKRGICQNGACIAPTPTLAPTVTKPPFPSEPPPPISQYPIPITPISFAYVSPGKIFDTYPTYPGSQPDQLQSTVSADLKKPIFSNLFTISGVKNYSIDEKGRFQGFTGRGVFATLTFVADKVGKAEIKLVYRGPSVTDDSNINGYLANQPVAGQKTVERLLSAPISFTVEVVPASQTTPIPVTTTPVAITGQPPLPTSTPSCLPKPPCLLNSPPTCVKDEPIGGWCPEPTTSTLPAPPPGCYYQKVQCIKEPCEPILMCPTPTPQIEAIINFKLALEERTNHKTSVDIYGMKTAIGAPQVKFSIANSIKLGTTTTDEKGYGKLKLDPSYIGRTFFLFAETPSHLRRAALNNQPILIQAGDNPKCASDNSSFCPEDGKYVSFGTLWTGNIYVDAKGTKDNIINSFDVGELFSGWNLVGKANLTAEELKKIESADLNGDGTVNNYDYLILIRNYNKTGDFMPLGNIRPMTR